MVGPQFLGGPLPRNIHDDQGFDESCTTIPPAQPDSVPTPVSYLIAKTRLVFGFARALDEISRSEAMRWERLLEIDRELRHIYDDVPDHFKIGRLSSQDSLVLVSARFTLSSIHHKTLCVLHSRFLESTDADGRFLYSRRVCLSSAMSILRFQAIQNQNIPVDGHLRSLTSYQTSLAIHDYLLAAAIITAELCSGRTTDHTASQHVLQGVPTRTDMIKALALSARIFGQMREESLEAYKAADILEMLVRKFEAEDHNDGQRLKDKQCEDTCHDIAGMRVESRGPSDSSLTPPIAHTNAPALQRSNLPEASCVDTLSSWSDHRVSDFCDQSSPLPQMFSYFEPSSNWMMPEVPTVRLFIFSA